MPSFPSQKVHRINRRKLGRGQYPTSPAVLVAVNSASDTVTLTFNQPVVVSGPIPIVVGSLVPSSQAVVSSTVVTITYPSPVTTLAWHMPANAANVATYQGGGTAASSGTFS